MAVIVSLGAALALVGIFWAIFVRERWYFFSAVADGRTIGIQLPRHWRRVFDPSAPILFDNISDGSRLLITPVPLEVTAAFVEKWDQLMEGMVASALPNSVEEVIPVHPFSGMQTRGHYICSTDKQVRPGEYRFMTSGLLLLAGARVLQFSVLSHISPPTGIKGALAGLESLVLLSAPSERKAG